MNDINKLFLEAGGKYYEGHELECRVAKDFFERGYKAAQTDVATDETKVKELVEAILIIGARRANDSLNHDSAKELIKQHIESLSKRVVKLNVATDDDWISVEDRLPEVGEDECTEVIMNSHLEHAKDVVLCGVFWRDNFYICSEWNEDPDTIEPIKKGRINKWMPLPKPQKQ